MNVERRSRQAEERVRGLRGRGTPMTRSRQAEERVRGLRGRGTQATQ